MVDEGLARPDSRKRLRSGLYAVSMVGESALDDRNAAL